MSKTPLTYDLESSTFSDGGWIDWFVYEPVSTAWVTFEDVKPGHKMTKEYLSTLVTFPTHKNTIELRLPVQRFGEVTRTIELPKQITISEILKRIHSFYDTPITWKDIPNSSEDGYVIDALKNMCQNKRVTWLNLIGSKVPFPKPTKGVRRSSLSCSGAVCFEEIRKNRNGSFEIFLGS
jgi:hypothetical protein